MFEMEDASTPSLVADWIELYLATEHRPISKMEVRSNVSLVSGEDSEGSEDVFEAFISDIWQELERRQGYYLESPFFIKGNQVIPNVDSTPMSSYKMCLILSMAGNAYNTSETGKLFERLVSEALKKYVGKAEVFGWPFDANQSPDDMTILGAKTEEMASKLNERFKETPAIRFKDRGLDVVGWKPFGEKRSGQLVLLVQCAAGHDWKKKKPVPIDAWREYIHWASSPIRAFAVPCVVSKRDWHDVHKDLGLIVDRIRLFNLLLEGIEDENLQGELESWVSSQLD